MASIRTITPIRRTPMPATGTGRSGAIPTISTERGGRGSWRSTATSAIPKRSTARASP
jgi:hypothetical protein